VVGFWKAPGRLADIKKGFGRLIRLGIPHGNRDTGDRMRGSFSNGLEASFGQSPSSLTKSTQRLKSGILARLHFPQGGEHECAGGFFVSCLRDFFELVCNEQLKPGYAS
jgi:hypothetical protein